MGLFDKLKEIAETAEKMGININANQPMNQTPNQSANRGWGAGQSTGSPAAAAMPNTATGAAPGFSGSTASQGNMLAFYENILNGDFPQYELRKNVPLSALGSSESGRPYDFVLYQNGRPVSVIVMSQKNKTRNRAYWNSEKAAQAAGVPFINFWTHMFSQTAADRPYVVNRIKQKMGLA